MKLADLLEPNSESSTATSQAISLKRLADATSELLALAMQNEAADMVETSDRMAKVAADALNITAIEVNDMVEGQVVDLIRSLAGEALRNRK